MGSDYRHPSRRWIILLATVVGMAVTARMGRWQLSRAAEKETLQSALDQRGRMPPLAVAALARTAQDADAQHYRHIRVSGRWLASSTVYLDNRPMDEHAGFIVVTPLLLSDGDAVVVQRGWVPRNQLVRTSLPPVITPQGLVMLEARVAPPPSKLWAFAGEQPGPIRQNLDLAAYAPEVAAQAVQGEQGNQEQSLQPLHLRPLSLVQLSPVDAQDTLLRHWPAPAVNVGTHYGYAVQWFGMCALMAGLYVWFQLIRPQLGSRR